VFEVSVRGKTHVANPEYYTMAVERARKGDWESIESLARDYWSRGSLPFSEEVVVEGSVVVDRKVEASSNRLDSFLKEFFRRNSRLRKFAPKDIREVSGGGGSHPEARQQGRSIKIYPKFWDLDFEAQTWVMAHEIGHYFLSEYGYRKYTAKAPEYGIDVWDTPSLPYGQFNAEEAFADAFAALFLNPSELKSRYAPWFGLLQEIVLGKKGSLPKSAPDEKWLTQVAVQAFSMFRSSDPARTSEDVAYAVGGQAKRKGWTEQDLKRWLQSAYSGVWVRQSNLNPGLDLKEVQNALLKGWRTVKKSAKTLEQLWDEGSQWRDAATTYVDISREEFEDWVADATRAVGKKWDVKPGTRGVYRIHLSKGVCIEVGSSQAQSGKSVGYAKGSMQMRLVSLLTGRTLNKKAQGKSHFKRTKNWRTTLLKAAKAFKSTYLDSQPFYEALAEIGPSRADKEKYTSTILTAIDQVPGWDGDDDLRRYYYKVQRGGVLTLREKTDMEGRVQDALRGVPRRNEEQEAEERGRKGERAEFKRVWDTWLRDGEFPDWVERVPAVTEAHKRFRDSGGGDRELEELYATVDTAVEAGPAAPAAPAPEPQAPAKDSAQEERRKALLGDMRKLWVAAKKRSESTKDPRREKDAQWTMEFVASVGKQLTEGGRDWPTDRQIDLLHRKMDDYGL